MFNERKTAEIIVAVEFFDNILDNTMPGLAEVPFPERLRKKAGVESDTRQTFSGGSFVYF